MKRTKVVALALTAVLLLSGFAAVPSDEPSYIGPYDASQEAEDGFRAWWDYEVQASQDYRKSFDNKVYPSGVTVCAARALGKSPSTIENSLVKNNGFTRSGAAAIIKGALNSLCPKVDTGYITYFDEDVQAFQSSVEDKITLPSTMGTPNEIDYGWFLKETCAYIQLNAGKTNYDIYTHMRSFGYMTSKPFFYVSGVSVASTDPAVTYTYIQQAVLNGCLGLFDRIPLVIQAQP